MGKKGWLYCQNCPNLKKKGFIKEERMLYAHNLVAYDKYGRILKRSIPVFVDIEDKIILKKINYHKLVKYNRFDIMDLEE